MQARVSDLAQQLSQSEQNELALLRQNRLQVEQMEKLRERLASETTSNSLVIMSKTS